MQLFQCNVTKIIPLLKILNTFFSPFAMLDHRHMRSAQRKPCSDCSNYGFLTLYPEPSVISSVLFKSKVYSKIPRLLSFLESFRSGIKKKNLRRNKKESSQLACKYNRLRKCSCKNWTFSLSLQKMLRVLQD